MRSKRDAYRAELLRKIGERYGVAPEISALRLLTSDVKDAIKGFLTSEIMGDGLSNQEINDYGVAADDLIDDIGF